MAFRPVPFEPVNLM